MLEEENCLASYEENAHHSDNLLNHLVDRLE